MTRDQVSSSPESEEQVLLSYPPSTMECLEQVATSPHTPGAQPCPSNLLNSYANVHSLNGLYYCSEEYCPYEQIGISYKHDRKRHFRRLDLPSYHSPFCGKIFLLCGHV